MHEVSLIQNILHIVETTAAENNINKVSSITLRIGTLSCVMERALIFAFDCMCKNTIADNAVIKIERISATASCKECNITFQIDHYNKLCPKCNRFCSSILTGNELYISSIEGD